jgi:DNA invertase Pin-like site-specific DNA recombinase
MKETLHIYTRVSTSKQEVDGTSLETQKELGIERSKVLGMKYKVWNEGAESSSKDDLDNRPVITELLSEVEQGNVKHIYVWNTDRLSRNIQTWGMIRLRFIQKEVHLHLSFLFSRRTTRRKNHNTKND